MASERDAAKGAASDPENVDGELGEALKEANQFRLSLAAEDHRHAEQMARHELGWFGQLFGNKDHAPTMVALVALVLFAVIGVACLLAAYSRGTPGTNSSLTAVAAIDLANAAKGQATFWSDNAKNAFAVCLSALGFIFGRGGGSKG